MVRKVLYPAVFVLVMLMTAPAMAAWKFSYAMTPVLEEYPPEEYGEYRILMPESLGGGLVPEGCLVQFIVDIGNDGIDDPVSFFDVNHNGTIDGAELLAVQAWVNAGANPAAFSDDQLLTASDWNGTSLVGGDSHSAWDVGPGEINVFPVNPFMINNGAAGNRLAWRVWNLSPEGLETFCTRPGEQLWYTTGREFGTFPDGVVDTGWFVGAPLGSPPGDWVGLANYIGYEEIMYYMTGDPQYRSEDRLDHKLGECPIPEPSTMLLIGGSALLLILRRKK